MEELALDWIENDDHLRNIIEWISKRLIVDYTYLPTRSKFWQNVSDCHMDLFLVSKFQVMTNQWFASDW